MDENWKNLQKEKQLSLLEHLIRWRFPIKETLGFLEGQVCTGGVSLQEVTESFESKLVPHLYFAGEILDVDGDCGGYNLSFAWISGMTVGKDISRNF